MHWIPSHTHPYTQIERKREYMHIYTQHTNNQKIYIQKRSKNKAWKKKCH